MSWFVQPAWPIGFETVPRQFDEVTPSINPQFNLFNLPAESQTVMSYQPPVWVHFGKMRIAPQVTTVLYQRVGSLVTERPLLTYFEHEGRKTGVMLGEGIYRWRMQEFSQTGRTEVTDELFLKFIQYLATTDDKNRFRCYPVKSEFSQDEPVVFESQVYNEIFEPVYGNTIDLEIVDEQAQPRLYSYVTQPSLSRYAIHDLPEGAYRFTASTTLGGKREKINGQFVVTGRQIEMQNLTADFDVLRRLSAHTGGKFYRLTNWNNLTRDLTNKQARYVVHSEEQYTAAINLPWVLAFLLVLVSTEWFLRKFYGGY